MSRKKHQDQAEYPSFRRPQLNLRKETRRGVAVVIFVVLAVIFTLSLIGVAGPFGSVANQVLKLAFGWVAFVVPIIFLVVAVALFRQNPQEESSSVSTHAYVGAVLLTLTLTGLLHLWVIRNDVSMAFDLVKAGHGGGYLGILTSYPLMHLMGFYASLIILLAGLVISILVTFNVSFFELFQPTPKEELAKQPLKPNGKLKINNAANAGFTKEAVGEVNKAIASEKLETTVNNLVDLPPVTASKMASKVDKNWKFPSIDLLDDAKTKVDSGNIEANVSIIQKTLNDFGIEVEMGEVNVGPTVTQYTFRPAVGVKLSQIASLQNDIALALAASSLRMELPIPGKALVGIEIPNITKSIVRIKEIVGNTVLADNASKLAFALGRDVAGNPIAADLSRMPHLLIAGATGSGKSVAVNSILLSMLFRATPQEVKFVIIDPKRVELNLYNDLPHLLTPVITDHQKAVNALKWTVAEMDRRYKLLSEVHKRNITEYNASSPTNLPYIVVVVDELADLMSVSQNEVEATIVRLAQMARAVGIHLVVATQRPSVDVITGLIKANITARMAFAVASQVDSRTILDSAGAEKLLGSGDMLYVTAELPKPKRIQGSFVTEKEIKKVVDFIKGEAGSIIYDTQITEKPTRDISIPGFEGTGGDDDELLQDAIETVRNAGKASASLLQRRLRVGYARAARLLDILEDKGIIGPGEGAKPREVYGSEGTTGGEVSEEDEFEKSQEGQY
ncbi:MAG TPA: DNA translocase FtsK 4TM domain-containing protein [Methylomirabilota bacterium]|nr:DNA translocase FtsK 4TM domain-containing protein [Methylomirabilota bacterium]